jgi:hypothetical protein
MTEKATICFFTSVASPEVTFPFGPKSLFYTAADVIATKPCCGQSVCAKNSTWLSQLACPHVPNTLCQSLHQSPATLPFSKSSSQVHGQACLQECIKTQ